MSAARLAVLGSPIEHSRSPELHAAAYRVLGLDWEYTRADVTEAGLPGFLAGLGQEWIGLSLTMPLKRAVLPLVAEREPLVDRLGLANTLLLGPRPRLFNTDVAGMLGALALAGAEHAHRVVVLGGGATAASALEAALRLGAAERIVAVRDPARAAAVLGGATAVVPFPDAPIGSADLVVSTLPGGALAPVAIPARVDAVPLLDVAYDPWPSALGAAWAAAGGVLVHGLAMLLEQALVQVRIFTGGDPEHPLRDECAVRAAMSAAIGLPGTVG